MAWTEYPMGNVTLGAGAGLSAVFDDSFDVCLAAGLNASYHFSESWGVVLGVTGNLDCFPSVESTENENSTSYKFKASDFARNNLVAKIGATYHMGL